ncbi:MAG: alpha amylase N-terminal ig-like domain-containing protein [Phycisphaerae bacterium]|nr:alpha amylase N-terminal ig-like domain-containing protein [Phycisphaerae bacterium]
MSLAWADWPPAAALHVEQDADPGRLPPTVRAEPTTGGTWRCTFRYKPPGRPDSVTLAGTFNSWNRAATPMEGPDNNGFWEIVVDLPGGEHLYKFVLDGERWLHDANNPDSVPDGHGGRNSVLRLGSIANLKQADAQLGDGRIEARAIEHHPDRPLYYQRLSPTRALVRLRTLANDIERVKVAVRYGGTAEMSVAHQDAFFTLWEGTVTVPSDISSDEIRYTFVLTDGDLQASSPKTYGVPVSKEKVFQTPEWARHAVWYQIMLDRFRNGNPDNDRDPVRPWTSAWFTKSEWEGKDGQAFYKYFVFDRQYGGDIDGLEEKLPYLKELGVNAIYLNPVFKAESHHKYNAETYLHIDDHFGAKGDYAEIAAGEDHNDPSTWKWTETDKRFLRFLKTAHAQGFKVIVDGVFNHVGTAHPAFQDVKKNGKQSKYADWFNVTSWKPFKYEGWFGHDALPVFKKSKDGLASAQVKQHIFNVTRRWMDPDGDGDPSDGIDGWRLDVPNEIPAPFWVEWREVVKSVNPDAYITGEIWERAEQWLDGEHFDAVMNYEFARGAIGWIFDKKWKITPSEIDRRFRELRLAYPLAATQVLQNLMDSHDTDRVASMPRNADRAYDHANRIQDNGPEYDNARPSPEDYARARLTALLQMTYIGAPMVYYGDEVGMWGADDPTCRKPMLWADLEPYEKPEENFVMKDQLAYYKQIIALRKAHPALRTGSFLTLLTDDEKDVWAFLRKDDNEQLIVALNASNKEVEVIVPLPLSAPNKWKGVFNAEGIFNADGHKMHLRVPALGGVVLHAATPK